MDEKDMNQIDKDHEFDKSNINNAVNDDKVLIELVSNFGKIEGRVLRVLSRDLSNLIGEIYFLSSFGRLLLHS